MESVRIRMDFSIASWAAWSTGLTTKEHWLAWAYSEARQLIEGDNVPQLAGMPLLLKRRAHILGRMALETMYGVAECNTPIVFCSRYGELHRTIGLLRELADTNSVSPQNFCMAVHNAIPSLYTIAQKSHVQVTAISAGPCSAIYGLVEALSLLADGYDRVRLVVANQVLPDEYQPFADQQMATYAYTLELIKGSNYSLEFFSKDSLNVKPVTNSDLSLLKFLISDRSVAIIPDKQYAWKLSRGSDGEETSVQPSRAATRQGK